MVIEEISVRKRDGVTVQQFQKNKVKSAVRAALQSIEEWDDTVAGELDAFVEEVCRDVLGIAKGSVVGIEEVQDAVERHLISTNRAEAAKAYILYRQKRLEVRSKRLRPDPDAISDYIHPCKYARYKTDLKRREIYIETVARVKKMHVDKYGHLFEKDPKLLSDIDWAFTQVEDKRVLPSMRSMQFGGAAIEKINERIYNCCFSFIDRSRAFAEALYLLLCGTGVGFSVQFEHVEKLPVLKEIDFGKVVHISIEDSIEGWANALDRLIQSYIRGYYVEFNYSKIRDKGELLKTSGGRAPGHMELKKALDKIRGILEDAVGRQLRPIECYDILCHAADAVLSGGIRRSAMICLFSLEDGEMMNAKVGSWYKKHPWRANSNNSVMLKRDDVKKKQFKRIFAMTRQWGEPGFYFCADYDHGTNPCVEIGLNPVFQITQETIDLMTQREFRGKQHPKVKLGDKYTGWAFCNLTEQNAARFKTVEDFLLAAKAATIIGTLQAGYTDFNYLGWVSECIAERESLLGIGMTGIMDSPEIALNPEFQKTVALQVVEWNKDMAARLGIAPAARTTCVKPSGTTSLELRGVASGIHGHHARRYIRRVTANAGENVFKYFRSINPHMCVPKPNGDWVIEFPVEAPDGARLKSDMKALEFLEVVKSTQVNWVMPGTARPDSTPGLTHNVSNTCIVGEEEWMDVPEFVWENRQFFTGVSFLPITGDKDFAFAPNEAITTEADEAKWNYLLANYKPVDYTLMIEDEDGTDLTGEVACAGGACLA